MQRVLSFPPPSRGFGDAGEFISKRMCFAFMFTLGFLAFLGGFLLGRFVFDKELERSRTKLKEAKTQKEQVFGVIKNYSQFNVSSIIDGLSEQSIQKYLEIIMSQSELPNSHFREAEILRDHLFSNSFDLISPLVETQVQLSYPSSKHPNRALIVGSFESTEINDVREKYNGQNEKTDGTVIVQNGVVNVNYGRDEDYQYLDYEGIPYPDKIFLMRGGVIPITEMVSNAIEHRASGILLYLDPQQPGVEIPLISPSDLAKLQSRYGNHIDKWAGTIPLLQISFEDASKIIKRLSVSGGRPAPDSWKGRLNSNPIFTNNSITIKMEVSPVTIVKPYYSVLGAMRGSQEPDRFVMLSNEKNMAKSDESSVSVMMEIVRVLGDLKLKGWRPHRSIVVAFWDAEGPNMHLSSHPTSVFSHIIRKTVAYLKIDSVTDTENETYARVSPMIKKLFYKSAESVYFGNSSTDIMPPLNTDNLFIQCGVPFIMIEHYNTNNFKEIASFWSKMTWNIVESYKLPFSLESYAKFFSYSLEAVEKRFKSTVQEHSLYLDSLFQSVEKLIKSIKSFEDKWSRADKSKSIEMRIMTDQLLDFTRFLLCNSDSTTSTNNHSSGSPIFTKSITGKDEKAGFGVLQDLLQDFVALGHPTHFQEQIVTHLASLVETINLACDALSDGLDIVISGNT